MVATYVSTFDSASNETASSVQAVIQSELTSNNTGTFLGPYQLSGTRQTAVTYTGKCLASRHVDTSRFYLNCTFTWMHRLIGKNLNANKVCPFLLAANFLCMRSLWTNHCAAYIFYGLLFHPFGDIFVIYRRENGKTFHTNACYWQIVLYLITNRLQRMWSCIEYSYWRLWSRGNMYKRRGNILMSMWYRLWRNSAQLHRYVYKLKENLFNYQYPMHECLSKFLFSKTIFNWQL